MNLEIVVPQIGEKGGMDKIINSFADFLISKGEKVRIVQLVDMGIDWRYDKSILVNLLDMNSKPSYKDAIEAYAEHLKKTEKIDMILAAGWPITITIIREAMKIVGNSVFLFGWPHMSFREAYEKEVGTIDCIADADAMIAISKLVENEIIESGIKVPIIRVNNGIELPKKYGICSSRTNTMKLLFVGRLVDGKNLNLIFRAIRKAKDRWELYVVGQGENEKAKLSCKENRISDRVYFTGFKDDPYENTNDISFCVVSSNYEGFCLVILEALSYGIPVISTPVGCAPEVIKPGVNGYLYGIGDDAMLTQILDMISDGKLPIPDAKKCRESVEKYNLDEVFEDFYNKLSLMIGVN